ncbi:unnamed protein product [Adineta ricciae]|uniref:Uncharacterized protein n=1 Tax=Adineta ricciae TaxID=249248 RepID=A0A815W4K2_ADIRI|nr:unnamed protein product [Adineta ricciae]CAF1658444.1 unnamed protein product [Adineta ricciae]
MFLKETVPLEYDCLYYVKSDGIVKFDESYDWAHELLTYCIRPDNQSSIYSDDQFNSHLLDNKKYTFAELDANAISTTQLFEWSAPIEIIENYQMYLENKNNNIILKKLNTDEKYLFYNCTQPWYGSRCQYSFMWKQNTLELYIDRIFSDAHLSPTLPACYIHLNCNRGLSRVCLDWREICNDKKDCLNGEDEEQCWKLETNLCDDNEYRCHNGQCIPIEFQNDGILNPDCMDRTDELKPISYPKKCIHDPTFRCEESSCYPFPGNKQTFACGDGECINPNEKCNNNRQQYAQVPILPIDMNAACWQAMNCLTGKKERNECSCIEEVQIPCISLAVSRCPELFIFPETSILSDHVYLMYRRPYRRGREAIIEPSYICFDKDLCTVPHTSIYEILNYTCIDYDEDFGRMLTPYPGWNSMVRFIRNVFLRVCTSPMIECSHSSLYRCNYTSKCISIYRLRDGIDDCQLNDDETYTNTCSINWNTMDRFKCSGENLCLSKLTIQNGISECLSGEDEVNEIERYLQYHITIQHICDGIQHLIPIEINGRNETDETECDLWKCDNSYTHCNSVWNCPKGEDELGCKNNPIICPPLHHPCISPNTTELFCLPITKINDDYMDCLGGSDERELCRSMYPWRKTYRYHCWDRNECVELESLKECKTEKDTKLWNIIGTMEKCTNELFSFYLLPLIKQHLCSLIDLTYIDFPGYSLLDISNKINNSRYVIRNLQREILDRVNSSLSLERISDSSLQMDFTDNLNRNQISTYIHPMTVVKNDHKDRYICHRGISIHFRTLNKTETKCMCPPSTYGYYCQYQSQRVSLTVQVRSATDWLSMFTLVFLLITDQNEIESYDYRYYNSITDCVLKWNIYLLYRTRPKDPSKNYTVRIYVYKRQTTGLEYRTSWHYPLYFPFFTCTTYRSSNYYSIFNNNYSRKDLFT